MTNITEYLGRDLLSALPTLCGYPTGGSDYICFSAFCRSTGRFPDSADVRQVRELLQRGFACDLPPDRQHCDRIWRMTAEALLSGDPIPLPTAADLRPPHAVPDLPVFDGTVCDCPPLQGAKIWQEWVTRTEPMLTWFGAVRVRLPFGFRACDPGLWHAERILRGEETDASLAAAQQVFFLAGFCRGDRRLFLETDCQPQEVLHILRGAARKRRDLPPLVWRWSPGAAPDRDTLLDAARLIRTPEGVPPILTSRTV